jgi:putative hydrolase of the HAD superfamily
MSTGVLFDLDETLIDRSASVDRYFRDLWAAYSASITMPEAVFIEELRRLDGNGYVDRPTFFQGVVDLALPSLSVETVACHFHENAWKQPVLMPGAVAGLEHLKGLGIRIGIVTNGGSRNQREKLRNTGLDAIADCVVISEEFGARKPDPSIFLSAAGELGIDPANCWFVGDHPQLDIVGAHRLGFQTIWLTRSVPWPESEEPCYTAKVSSLGGAFETIQGAVEGEDLGAHC